MKLTSRLATVIALIAVFLAQPSTANAGPGDPGAPSPSGQPGCTTYSNVINNPSRGTVTVEYALNCNRTIWRIGYAGVVEIDGKDQPYIRNICYEKSRCAGRYTFTNPRGTQRIQPGWDPSGTQAYFGAVVKGARDRLVCRDGISTCLGQPEYY